MKTEKNNKAYNISEYGTVMQGKKSFGNSAISTHVAGELTNAIYLSSPIGIYIVQDGKFKSVNPSFQMLTGYNENELLGMDSLMLVHPEDRDLVRGSTVKLLKKERYSPFEFRALNKTNEVRWIIGTVASVHYQGKRAVLGNYMDITERKVAEEALMEAHRELARKASELEEANIELDEYAYVVSHDIRASLRAIQNYAEFLREDAMKILGEEQKEYLDGLGNAVRQAEELVGNLLHLSRVGREELTLENIDCGKFLTELVSSLKLPSNVEVIMAKKWPRIEIEPVLFQQIFQNIIGNAVKFNNSSHKRVGLGWQSVGDSHYTFIVSDNGIGIDPKYRDRIFRMFDRLHTQNEYEGTGIGLAIVKKAVSKLKGEIIVDSKLGKGTTFRITLPRYQGESNV